jgi:hypothetical protein
VRKLLRVTFLVATTVGLSTVAFTSGAGAGEELPGLDAPLTIVKTVSGTVPAGTTFTVNLHCPDGNIDTGLDQAGSAAITATDAEVTFDAAGQPTSPDIIGFNDPGTCTVTETESGGAASVTYACAGTIPSGEAVKGFGGASAEQVEPPTEPCDAAGPQSAPMIVFIVNPGQDATVTVHNTFTDPTPTPAPAVVVQPVFTG